MDEARKERIIEAGIVERGDWGRLSPEHIALADAILVMMDLQAENPGLDLFNDESLKSEREQAEDFRKNITELNDEMELEDFDVVQPDKTFDAGIPIAIPMSLIPLFNKILKECP